MSAARSLIERGFPYLVRGWMSSHAQGTIASLGRLFHTPVATSMTVAVIAIALALPAGLHVLIRNVEGVAAGWDGNASLTLFLQGSVPDQQAERLAGELRRWPEVGGVRVVTRSEGLADLRDRGGFAAALDLLEENPLPAVLILRPGPGSTDPQAIEQLRQRLEKLPEADFAQLDLQWVRRLRAMTEILQRGTLLLAVLLGAGVLLIVGNTIRLEIDDRRQEIAIMELVGATPAFIRRPFLYSGFWYGLLGGLGAWSLVTLSLVLMQEPVLRLFSLYGNRFQFAGVDWITFLLLALSSTLLGLLGSWLSVTRHIAALDPT